MAEPITHILKRLDGDEVITRKQLARWLGRSLSYVDQRFNDGKDWSSKDVEAIYKKAFELEISDLMNRVLTSGQTVLDIEYWKHMVDGDIGPEMYRLQKEIGRLIDKWEAEDLSCKEHRELVTDCYMLIGCIHKEFENRN